MGKLSEQQKKELADRLAAGKKAKQQEVIDNAVKDKDELIERQKSELSELRTKVSDKNSEISEQFLGGGTIEQTAQEELNALRQELLDLKVVLSASGALPRKVSTTPWSSTERPFHKDIFKTKKKRRGYEIGWVNADELDDYLEEGYNVANGKDWGGKEGKLVKKRMVAVECLVGHADKRRDMQAEFNRRQRESSLQKTEEMSRKIQKASGRKTDLSVTF
jgi:hypothetical protein